MSTLFHQEINFFSNLWHIKTWTRYNGYVCYVKYIVNILVNWLTYWWTYWWINQLTDWINPSQIWVCGSFPLVQHKEQWQLCNLRYFWHRRIHFNGSLELLQGLSVKSLKKKKNADLMCINQVVGKNVLPFLDQAWPVFKQHTTFNLNNCFNKRHHLLLGPCVSNM